MDFNVDGVREGLNKAQELYVLYMAKKGAMVKLQDDVANLKAVAKGKYETAMDKAKKMFDEEMMAQGDRMDGAGDEVMFAENELKGHQVWLRQEFGIEINLLPKTGGGSVRL